MTSAGQGPMPGRIQFLALVAAMGGFLFGYDAAVINGAEQQIQSVWGLSAAQHGLVMSAALWGTVLGALFGGRLTDAWGRKRTLIAVSALYLVSAVWSAAATVPPSLVAARFVGGLGVGLSSIVAPVYIAEIAPAERRGRLGALFQFNIVLGMVMSQVANWMVGLAGLGDATWRWMLGAEALPALAFTALCPFLVESPRWLAMRGAATDGGAAAGGGFFSRANLKPIMLAFLVALFNQLSGIAVVLYFACRIFQMVGCSRETALAVTAGLTAFQGAATMLGLWLIDRAGRKKLLVFGGTGYVISLFACALALLLGWNAVAAVSVFVFVFSHAVGQGTVIWVFISEVFPQRYRAQGQSLGCSTHWVMCAALTFVFPSMVATMPAWSIFALFGVFMVGHLLWAVFAVPETKGRSLDEVAENSDTSPANAECGEIHQDKGSWK